MKIPVIIKDVGTMASTTQNVKNENNPQQFRKLKLHTLFMFATFNIFITSVSRLTGTPNVKNSVPTCFYTNL